MEESSVSAEVIEMSIEGDKVLKKERRSVEGVKQVIVRKPVEVLETEYIDLHYLVGFDVGFEVDVEKTTSVLYERFSRESVCAALYFVPIRELKNWVKKGWKTVDGVGVWIKPVCIRSNTIPKDIEQHIRSRAITDSILFSIEYLQRKEYSRIFLGEILFDLSEFSDKIKTKIHLLRGYLELYVNRNGVFVLTLTIPIRDMSLTSTDILKIRYLLEVEGVKVSMHRNVYYKWIDLRTSKPRAEEESIGRVSVKLRIQEVLEIYTTYIKYYLVKKLRGYKATDILDLERLMRLPWDTRYIVVFTELRKKGLRINDIINRYAIQLYAILHGTRRLLSRDVARRVIIKSFYYIPTPNIGELVSKPLNKVNVTRVLALLSEYSTHVVAISKKYLGATDVGLRIRVKHLTALELLIHLKHTLRVLEHLFAHKRPKDLSELANLRLILSRVSDLVENHYFIVDNDIREIFYKSMNVFNIPKLLSSVERKLESLNYTIMTRYQDKIHKMQLLLSILFGIFGVPFFIFSYVQWYFDYVATGKSQSFWPVTILTFIPTISILALSTILYVKWRREVFK